MNPFQLEKTHRTWQVWNMPIALLLRFNAWCTLHGLSLRQGAIQMLEKHLREVGNEQA